MKSRSTQQTKVTILGSGTCVPSINRSACAVTIKTGRAVILLDMGPGTMRRLLETGIGIDDITHIFISHFHPDHTAELVPMLFATKYPRFRRQHQLTIIAGQGFDTFFRGLESVYGNWIMFTPDILKIFELSITDKDNVVFDEFAIETIPVSHRPESLACRITDSTGASVVYSGDTGYSENLVTLAANADLFICESAVPDELAIEGHLTPSLAGEIAQRAKVSRLVLTHLYPECDDVDIEKQCKKAYDGPLVKAKDLMMFELIRSDRTSGSNRA